MNLLPRISECVRPPSPKVRPKVRPNAIESSPFRFLPPELILMIAGYLPPESAGILALSCTPLYSCLQMDYLEPLEDGESPAIYSFLDLLAQDLQTYIACPHCSKLHSTLLYKDHAGSNLYYQTWRPPRKPLLECQTADISSNLSLRIQPNFSSTLFRMVMKIYRQGQDTTGFLQQLSFRGFEKHGTWSAEKRIASARIIGGSLLMREQRVFMVSASQIFPVPCGDGASFYICAHFPNFTLQSLLKQGIQIPRSDFVEAYENEQGILCCDYCYTEFRIDFKSYGKAGTAMFVTRWMDIGEGRDVNDPKWRKRLAPEDRFDSFLTGQETRHLYKKGYWLSPNRDEIRPDDDIEPEYEVVDGRFVELPKHDGECFCIR